MNTSLKFQWTRVLISLIAALLILHPAPSPAQATTRWTDAQTEQVSEATRLFQRRQLQIPSVEMAFHDDDRACNGHIGYFRAKQRRIDVCSDLQFVLIHELAHVWIEDHVGPATRQAFVQRNGLPSWNDHKYDWADRGVELAAYTIQQVVMRDLNPRREHTREILANFAHLTGRRGWFPICQDGDRIP